MRGNLIILALVVLLTFGGCTSNEGKQKLQPTETSEAVQNIKTQTRK